MSDIIHPTGMTNHADTPENPDSCEITWILSSVANPSVKGNPSKLPATMIQPRIPD